MMCGNHPIEMEYDGHYLHIDFNQQKVNVVVRWCCRICGGAVFAPEPDLELVRQFVMFDRFIRLPERREPE